MKLKTFRYLGPDSAVTFREGGLRVKLLNGRNVELPPESKFVRDLLARKMLVPVTAASSSSAPTPAAPAAPPVFAPPAADALKDEPRTKADKKAAKES